MSRHRMLVRSTVDSLAEIIRPVFTLEMLQNLAQIGEPAIRINAVSGETQSKNLKLPTAVRRQLRTSVRNIGKDLREAFVEIRIVQSEKSVQSCVTAALNSAPQLAGTPRPFTVLLLSCRSVIRTRYVHMWHEWQVQERWPVGWVA